MNLPAAAVGDAADPLDVQVVQFAERVAFNRMIVAGSTELAVIVALDQAWFLLAAQDLVHRPRRQPQLGPT